VSLSPVECENQIGNPSMQTAASNNLIFTYSSSSRRLAEGERFFSHAGLYQGIAQTLVRGIHTKQTLAELAARLVSAADEAYSIRRLDLVNSAGELLLHLPLSRRLESIGHYYIALALNRGGLGDTVGASRLFERVAENASLRYRAKALLAMGTNFVMAGDERTAVSLYHEAMRIAIRDDAFDPVSFCGAAQMTAVIKGMNGDHRGAIVDLERSFPLARVAGSLRPHTYYAYLNALSVELAEAGSLEQARRASEIALTSPFSPAYPEWQETFDEITLKQRSASRSMVAVSGFIREPAEDPHRGRETQTSPQQLDKTQKLVSLTARQPAAGAEIGYDRAQGSQARVLDFQLWKRRVEPSPAQLSALSSKERMEMTTGEKLIRLMDLISQDDTDDETIDVILEAVEAIVWGRRDAT
jgi:hypothetical protein